MKILFVHRPGGAFGYITDGMINALRDKGHQVQRWDGIEDSWNQFAPELYIGASGHKQPIPPRRNCKIAIHVNPYGPVNIDGINENDNNIRWVLNQKPDAVFGYGQEDDRILWSYWTTKHQIQWVPMPTAGDRIIFKQLVRDEQKEHDLVYLGGHWSYKGLTIDSYLLPVLNSGINYKLYGWGDWPAGICTGVLSEDKSCKFLNSGKIGPCISERHTHSHGIDIPERAFKVALCGTLIVHDQTLSLKRMIPSAIITTTPAQFHEQCLYFIDPKNEHERKVLIAQQQREVLNAHTYHHRLSALFGALGFQRESLKMLEGSNV